MRRLRRLPKWYEEALLVDVSEQVEPLGIRVRTMATLPIHIEYFSVCPYWSLPMHTVDLCRLLLSEMPELADEVPKRLWHVRREANIWHPGPFVGPTVVCRIGRDGFSELVITKRSRDPWRALF